MYCGMLSTEDQSFFAVVTLAFLTMAQAATLLQTEVHHFDQSGVNAHTSASHTRAAYHDAAPQAMIPPLLQS